MMQLLGCIFSTEYRIQKIALDKEVDKSLDPTEEATLRWLGEKIEELVWCWS